MLTACYTEKHVVDPLNPNEQTSLDPTKGAYVSIPKDGVYGEANYNESGLMTATAIKSALIDHITRILMGKRVESYDEAVQSARSNNVGYLFYPTILHWEDRATEWSGKSDKIEIEIRVFDTETEYEVSSVIIKSNSSWWTFGGDQPHDLLDKPITNYINSLF